MFHSKLLMTSLILVSVQFGCKPRTATEADISTPTTKKTGTVSNNSGLVSATSDDEFKDPETAAAEVTVESLQKEISDLKTKLASGQAMTSAQKAEIDASLAKLEKAKEAADAALAAATAKQASAEKAAAQQAAAFGPSGYRYCGTVFYGCVYRCGPSGGSRCAKSDAKYQNLCEIPANAVPGAANPACAN